MRIGLVSSRSISYSRESNSINIPTGTDMKTGSHTCSDLACSGSVVGSSFRSVAGSGSESLTGSGGLRIRASSEMTGGDMVLGRWAGGSSPPIYPLCRKIRKPKGCNR